MIILLIFGFFYFGVQLGIALLTQLFYGVGLLLVLILGISFAVGKQRKVSSSVISITLKGIIICITFMLNIVTELISFAFKQGSKIQKRSKSFFVSKGISAGVSSALAGILSGLVVIAII